MAQIVEWGPHIWKILHSCAEHAGNSILQIDEIRAWIQVLRLTEGALPCAMCRGHYKSWRTSHPLEDFLAYRGDIFRERLREWIWELHEYVNTSRDVSGFPIEGLTAYKGVTSQELNQSMTTLVRVFEKAIIHRQVNPTYVTEWRRAVTLMRRLVGR